MPLNAPPPVRTSGHYGYAPVGAIIDTDPGPLWGRVNGVPMGMQYFYGSVRSAAGDYWWPIRGFYPNKARYLHLSESKVGEDFTYAKDHHNSYSGPVEQGEREGKWGVWTPDGTALMLTWDDKMEWHDGDEVSLTGDLVGKGLQFFSPDQEVPSSYSSRLFRVRGRIKGTEVSGLVFHDSIHIGEGIDYIASPYIAKCEAAWVGFATEFDDGTIHSGHLVHGTDDFNIMIVHRTDGPPLIARDIDVEVELEGEPFDEKAYPTKVTYTGGGQTWIWEANEGGRCPIRHDLEKGHRWRQGWVHQAGDTRKPVVTEALMETYNGRLIETGALKKTAMV
jgi:hypothetical protein